MGHVSLTGSKPESGRLDRIPQHWRMSFRLSAQHRSCAQVSQHQADAVAADLPAPLLPAEIATERRVKRNPAGEVQGCCSSPDFRKPLWGPDQPLRTGARLEVIL